MTAICPAFAATAPSKIYVTYNGTAISSKKVYKGASVQLGYLLSPTGSSSYITWKSSDSTIAKVNSKGVVTGVKYGYAKITASTSNGKSATIAIKVISKYPVRLTMSKSSVTLAKGRYTTLKATPYPSAAYLESQALTWKSSNTAVATVNSSGQVKAVKAGTTTITATAKNGTVKASCKVTVKNTVFLSSQGANGRVGYYYINGRRYTLFSNRKLGGWYRPWSCILTATAIAATGVNKNVDPVSLHTGSVAYSEKNAYKAIGGSNLYESASISVYAATYMLRKMGIPATYRTNYSSANTAINEITDHVKGGKPVIMIANNLCSCGVKIQGSFHAQVLVGISSTGKGIWIDPSTGSLNYAVGSNQSYSMTVEHYVRYHMTLANSSGKTTYTYSTASSGGYILVG